MIPLGNDRWLIESKRDLLIFHRICFLFVHDKLMSKPSPELLKEIDKVWRSTKGKVIIASNINTCWIKGRLPTYDIF